MTKQIEQGKAFEYACLLCLYEKLRHTQSVSIVEDESYKIAKRYYEGVEEGKQHSLDKASAAAMRAILRLEPCLTHPDGNNHSLFHCKKILKGRMGMCVMFSASGNKMAGK